MSGYQDFQRDNDRLRQRADANDRTRNRDNQADVVIEDPRRLFLRSPNGTYFSVSVDDAGTLSTVNMGTNPL
jgi:hypothetical protein